MHHSKGPDILNRAVHEVIKAIRIEEAALSGMVSWERELMQKAKSSAMSLEEFVAANASVNQVLRNIGKLQMLTQLKLQCVEDLLLKLEEEAPDNGEE